MTDNRAAAFLAKPKKLQKGYLHEVTLRTGESYRWYQDTPCINGKQYVAAFHKHKNKKSQDFATSQRNEQAMYREQLESLAVREYPEMINWIHKVSDKDLEKKMYRDSDWRRDRF